MPRRGPIAGRNAVGRMGDWSALSRQLSGLDARLQKEAKLAINEIVSHAEQVLKGHILNQDLGWSNKDWYTAWKRRHGYATEVWAMTWQLFDSIAVDYFFMGRGHTAFVGIRRSARNDEGESLYVIANVLEYGSVLRRISPKPLFRPTVRELQPYIRARIKQAARAALVRGR